MGEFCTEETSDMGVGEAGVPPRVRLSTTSHICRWAFSDLGRVEGLECWKLRSG